MIEVDIAQAYSTGTHMYDEDAQLKTEMTKNQAHTVAQKTAPMFTHLSMLILVWNADIIRGPEILS